MMQPARALSFLQPWLWTMTSLPGDTKKPIENRTWRPPSHIIGTRIALHASAGIEKAEVWTRILELTGGVPAPGRDHPSLSRGCIVATAEVVGYITEGDMLSPHIYVGLPQHEARGHELAGSRWFFGPVGWLLHDIQMVKPVKCKGALGLWGIPPDLTLEAMW